jgi:hypothetical protein
VELFFGKHLKKWFLELYVEKYQEYTGFLRGQRKIMGFISDGLLMRWE